MPISAIYILIALSILPVLLLGLFVYRKDKFQKEPLGMLLKAFFFGCLSILPAMLMEMVLSGVYEFGFSWLPGIFNGLFNGYVVAGCSEELCKLVMLFLAVWWSRHFDEYFDGIVYATFVALGFAACENVMYIFGQEDFGTSVATGVMRALLAVPGHFLFGVAMGYYFGLAKFRPSERAKNILLAFLFPMLLHGTYDALLMVPDAMGVGGTVLSVGFFILFVFFDIRLWKIGMRKLKELQMMDAESMSSSSNWNDIPQNPYSGINWDA
jgi:RsiW-degrading membrane proteinase PrsW (M82 family)